MFCKANPHSLFSCLVFSGVDACIRGRASRHDACHLHAQREGYAWLLTYPWQQKCQAVFNDVLNADALEN